VRRIDRVWRAGVAALALISWLALSNHCALGLLPIEHHTGIGQEEHGCCASDVPTHSRPARQPGNPCCKTLPVVLVTVSTLFHTSGTTVVGQPVLLAWVTLAYPQRVQVSGHFLDTGPPAQESFAEKVLQRSVLAHAPPSLS